MAEFGNNSVVAGFLSKISLTLLCAISSLSHWSIFVSQGISMKKFYLLIEIDS